MRYADVFRNCNRGSYSTMMRNKGEMSDSENLPVLQRVAFGTGHILNIMAVVGMWYPYSVTYFQKVVGLSFSSTATIILVSQVVGALVTPFIGIWSDSCVCKYGRRKIFHLIGMISVAASFFFIWFQCIGCAGLRGEDERYKVLYYTSFAVVFQFGWACTQICQLALIPELTSNKATKVELNSIRYGVQVASALFVFVIMWILLVKLDYGLVDQKHFGSHTKSTFWVLALIVIIVGFVFSLPFQIFVREKSNVILKKLKWYKWLKNPNFYLVICVFISAKLVTVIPLTYIPLYFLETLEMNKTSIAVGPLVVFAVSCILTPFAKKVSKYVGIEILFIVGVVIVWISMLWFNFHKPAHDPISTFNIHRDDIYVAVILFGIGGTALSVVALTLVSLLVGEYSGSGAFVYGWAFFADRLSNGIVNNIVLRIHVSDEGEFYRSIIVNVTLVASSLGFIAVFLMKVLELCQEQRKKDNSAINETESQVTQTATNYGAIQSDGSFMPLLKSSDNVTNGIGVVEEQGQESRVQSVDTSPETDQDTLANDKREFCDLSVLKSVCC